MHLILPKISQPLQNENEIYSDVSKIHCQEGGNVMIHKPHLTFHRNTEWMMIVLILPVSPFSLYVVVISLKTDNGFPNEEKK